MQIGDGVVEAEPAAVRVLDDWGADELRQFDRASSTPPTFLLDGFVLREDVEGEGMLPVRAKLLESGAAQHRSRAVLTRY